MKAEQSDGKLVIHLEGRIDSNNASAIEQEIHDAVAGHEAAELVFDAEKLTYISSAGLRVLMKMAKRTDGHIKVSNVSRDIYDIFDTTGFTELLDIQKAYRKVDVDGMEVIGRGFFGTVYRMDSETIIKVYKGKDSIPMIENEKRMAKKAFLSGIPTAISYDIVQVGEDYGSVFELLNARTFNDLVIEGEEPLEDIIAGYTDLLKVVHSTTMAPGELPSYKKKYGDYLEVIRKHLTEAQYDSLKGLLSDMPDDTTVVHGDIQMKNVMKVGDEAMLIDMDTLGLGNPVFEFAGLYVTYILSEEDEPGNSMAFLGIPREAADAIWDGVVSRYFSFDDEARMQETIDRIRLAAEIRFLYLLETTELKNGELGERRIRHTAAHMEELLKTVKSLAITRDVLQ